MKNYYNKKKLNFKQKIIKVVIYYINNKLIINKKLLNSKKTN